MSTADADIRIEEDLIGKVTIPKDALYGIQTARALENFRISDVPLHHFPSLVNALAMTKKAAALANLQSGVLDEGRAKLIASSCEEILKGRYHDQFLVDMVQGGAGTSTNMNANEVIANIALRRAGHECGEYGQLHPNDHVNLSQSTNDVYPTAIRLAALQMVSPLIKAQQELAKSFHVKAAEFVDVQKVGRTQLQDAVPMTLGQEFGSFAVTIEEDVERIKQVSQLFLECNLGGTAIGTGVNTPNDYGEAAVAFLSRISGFDMVSAKDLVEASSDLGAFVVFSGVLKRVAIKLSKICNDLRLLSSGPRAGIGEISLPAVQAGSSIMPGKVNPVIPEVMNQIAYQVVGNDLTICMAAESGQLQLNAMEPIVAYKLLDSFRVLTRGMDTLRLKCVDGITANKERCASNLENSLVFATDLVPILGYDKAAIIAKTALAERLTLIEASKKLGLCNEKVRQCLER